MRQPSTAGHTSPTTRFIAEGDWPAGPRNRWWGSLVITGTAGFLGSTLLKALEDDSRYRHILALDKQRPPFKLKKAKWIPVDLTETGADQKLADLFDKHHVQTVVHAALLTQPLRDIETAHEIQSVGTLQLLTASAAAKVHKLILASTTDVYGAFPDNPNFLTEDHQPKGSTLSPFLKDKVEVEEQFLNFAKKHPNKVMTILRPATILGPTVNNFKTHFFQNALVPIVMGFDPLIQFVHETDVLRAFFKVLEGDHPGIYNIVTKGVLPLSRAIRSMGKLPIPIPTFLLYPAAEMLWYMNIGMVPASHINFLKYLCVADGTKAWHKLKFKPIYTSQEALLSFIGKDLKKEEIAKRLEEIEDAQA